MSEYVLEIEDNKETTAMNYSDNYRDALEEFLSLVKMHDKRGWLLAKEIRLIKDGNVIRRADKKMLRVISERARREAK